MEKVPGKRPGTTLYMDSETGHLYRRYKQVKNSDKRYMTCYNKKCAASGIYLEESNTFVVKSEHSHESDKKAVDERQLIASIKHRLETEDVDPRTIFEEERQRFDSPLQYRSIKQTMLRHRKKLFPGSEDNQAVKTIGGDRRSKNANVLRFNVPATVSIVKAKVPEVVKTETKEDDEFSYFGNNIACQLRKLPVNEALVIQREIMDMLLIARQRISAATAEAVANAAETGIPVDGYVFIENVTMEDPGLNVS